MTTENLLIEIGTEELPPKFLKKLSDDFKTLISNELTTHKLSFTGIKTYATPRRIALLITGLTTRQNDFTQVRKGPPVNAAFKEGAPTAALSGFARSCGIDINQLTIEETPKGAWYTFCETIVGKETATLIPGIVSDALNNLPIAKRMRWADHPFEFVRPVRWLILLLGAQVIETTLMGVQSGRTSQGHRFHAPRPLTIDAPEHYEHILETEGFVIPDFEKRQQMILDQTHKTVRPHGTAVIQPELLNEVTALVEWPNALIGQFESRFLQVPQEALISTMQDNQKYFPIVNHEGTLTEFFCFISNINSKDPHAVISGNERVIRPRFSDADFFWNTDKNIPLDSYLQRLSTTIFQTKLGSQKAKMERVASLADYIAKTIQADREKTAEAAKLYKSDLLSNMVQEFPELQGIMGRYYALHQGLDKTVASALEEVYWPKFSKDQLPTTKEAQALAIAERIDTIVGIFAIGEPPSGSRDPFSLRRHTLGILRILIEKELPLDLKILIDLSLKQMPADLQQPEVTSKVLQYILERMRALTAEEGIPHDTFEAVITQDLSIPLDIYQRLLAIAEFRTFKEAQPLILSNKRIQNILQKNNATAAITTDESLFVQAEEKALYAQLKQAEAPLTASIDTRDYVQTLRILASFAEPLENFFDKVMVIHEDPGIKGNRIALLNKLNHLFGTVANLSLLQE